MTLSKVLLIAALKMNEKASSTEDTVNHTLLTFTCSRMEYGEINMSHPLTQDSSPGMTEWLPEQVLCESGDELVPCVM